MLSENKIKKKKKHLEENMHSYIQNNQIQKNHSDLSCARILYKEVKLYKESNSYAKGFCQNS